MRLKKMALIAEVAGGIGIIVSILYLAYEVSQNSETMELNHHLRLSEQYLSLRQSIIEDGEIARIIVRGNADISSLEPAERLRFEDYLTSMWDIWENMMYMGVTGRIDEGTQANWDRAVCLRLASPGSATAWADGLYRQFGAQFRPVVNDCFSRSDLPTAAIAE